MEKRETLTGPRVGPLSASLPTLNEVFLVSYRRLVVQLYGVVGNIDEAEDLVQEAFVRASAARTRFLAVANHEAWLRRTAINLHRNRWRKLRNFRRVKSRLVAVADLEGLDEHVAVIDALRRLPLPQREVLALHYIADLSVHEIAELLGVAEGTVKSRLSRAREALAHLLTDEELSHE